MRRIRRLVLAVALIVAPVTTTLVVTTATPAVASHGGEVDCWWDSWYWGYEHIYEDWVDPNTGHTYRNHIHRHWWYVWEQCANGAEYEHHWTYQDYVDYVSGPY